jgi:hypothetical protein
MTFDLQGWWSEADRGSWDVWAESRYDRRIEGHELDSSIDPQVRGRFLIDVLSATAVLATLAFCATIVRPLAIAATWVEHAAVAKHAIGRAPAPQSL